MIVVLPVYRPEESLVSLVEDLRAANPATAILIVDDGSGPAADRLLDACAERGCEVLRHPTNRGKGAALRTAFAHLTGSAQDAVVRADAVVCADADGQHTATDIRRVADRVADTGGIVLGVRRFDGKVPLRSRIGNVATRILFRAATGTAVIDTQTGLRGFPAELMPWLCSIPGERFDYEMNMLLEATRTGRGLGQVEVDTVYLAGNSSSHFGPLPDSVRVYRTLLRYLISRRARRSTA
jgi:glycosyltransferase involved in cell wall biosynthesis